MTEGTWSLGTVLRVSARNTRVSGAGYDSFRFGDGVRQGLEAGTGSATASLVVALTRGLVPGGSDTFDLFDGSLTDVFGATAAFRVLRGYALWVEDGGDSSGITLSGGASNPHGLFMGGTTPSITAYPDGPALTAGSPAGSLVTSTARTLKILNNGAVETQYTLVLAGSQAASGALMGILGLTYP